MSDERTTHTIVCVGLGETPKGKRFPLFREVLADDALGDQSFGWDGVKGSAGNVYQIDASGWSADKKTVFVPKGGRLRWLRLWPDREQRAAWEAEVDAVEAQASAEKLRADAERSSALDEMIAPLARAYARLPYHGGSRSAFLNEVHTRIVNMSRKEKKQ